MYPANHGQTIEMEFQTFSFPQVEHQVPSHHLTIEHQVSSHHLVIGPWAAGSGRDWNRWGPFRTFSDLFFKFKHQVSSHLLNIGPRAAGSGRDRNRWGPALTSQSRVSVRQDSSLDSYLQIFRTCFQLLYNLYSRNAGTRISDTCIFFPQKWGCPYPLPHILDNAQISVVKINDRRERVSVQLCVNVMSLGYLQ